MNIEITQNTSTQLIQCECSIGINYKSFDRQTLMLFNLNNNAFKDQIQLQDRRRRIQI